MFLESATTRYDHTAVLTLALDTTTRAGSVAVLRGTTVLAAVEGDASRTHGERLPAELERALSDAGVARDAVELLVVGSGPGAFTGLRIGLAAVQGLAMVLRCPVVGVSALDALVLAARERVPPHRRAVAAWMDAQRGEVYGAFYPADAELHDVPPVVGTPAALLASVPAAPTEHVTFTGDGAERYAEAIHAQLVSHATVLAPPRDLARFLGVLGQARARRGEAGPPHTLQPLYVRRPDAELERDRQLARGDRQVGS